MARAMFEYTKTVLEKVTFSPPIFCKELQKATQRLLPYELQELRIWLFPIFNEHPELRVCQSLIDSKP